MPNYDFKCTDDSCGHQFEVFVPMDERENELGKGCPECGAPLKQVLGCALGEGFGKNKLIFGNEDPDDPAPPQRDTSSRSGRAHRKMMQDRFAKRNKKLDDLAKRDPAMRDRMTKFMNRFGVKRNY